MPAHMSPPAGRPVGSGSSLIWNVRPQVFAAPGKNSAALVSSRLTAGRATTRRSPMLLTVIRSTGSARRISTPSRLPRPRIICRNRQ